MIDRPYAGIGSRETPLVVCVRMTNLAARLADWGYSLRTGCADGADAAFLAGAEDAEVFTTEDRYPAMLARSASRKTRFLLVPPDLREEAERIAREHHPNWKACSTWARAMHTRNVCQILGPRLDSLSRFIVCWTIDGNATGGTGQALRIATSYGVPIFNLFHKGAVSDLREHLEDLELIG